MRAIVQIQLKLDVTVIIGRYNLEYLDLVLRKPVAASTITNISSTLYIAFRNISGEIALICSVILSFNS